MVDDLRSDDGLGSFDGHKRSARSDAERRPLSDREVPLGQPGSEQRMIAAAVHAWLDGDLPEASVRRGDTARDVEFWRQMNDEAERRRHMRTPSHVQMRIMESLPHSTPAIITPWFRREFVVTPRRAVAGIAGLVALSALATAVVMTLMR